MQKVLICSTSELGMKSEIWGWSSYDSDAVSKAAIKYPDKDVWNNKKYVGFINSQISECPITPLHALAVGWKLLEVPKRYDDGENLVYYEWWFVKD